MPFDQHLHVFLQLVIDIDLIECHPMWIVVIVDVVVQVRQIHIKFKIV